MFGARRYAFRLDSIHKCRAEQAGERRVFRVALKVSPTYTGPINQYQSLTLQAQRW